MQAAPARYVSVSELYSTDEVELLLDEIRELEPTSCRGEDVQDFEIAGSGCGGGLGGRSPAGTEVTERSWDSHAQYLREPPPQPQPLAPLYCHLRYLLSVEGFFTLIIVLCCVSACGCVWAAAGLRLESAARPFALGALSSLLLHLALLATRLSLLHRLMPLDWHALGMYSSAWSAVSLCGGSSLLLSAALSDARYLHPPHLRDKYFAAIGLGYIAALAGSIQAGVIAVRKWGGRTARRSRRSSASGRGAYRAVPTASPAPLAPGPSTSRHGPL